MPRGNEPKPADRPMRQPFAKAGRTVLKMPTVVLTVGHSNRPLEEFLHLLDAHGVKRLVDVRTVPRSRRNPQFNKDSLPQPLERAGIAFTHMPDLGGLRHPRKDSQNLGWQNEGFRGFADYMQTPEFEAALRDLIRMAEKERVAIMCAEAVPWRCHRSLIADALLAHDVRVEHILSVTSTQPHKLTPFAHVFGTEVTYPGLPFVEPENREKSS